MSTTKAVCTEGIVAEPDGGQSSESAKLELSKSCDSMMKMRVVGADGRRITVMNFCENDPSNREAWELIQHLDAKGGGEIDLSCIVKTMSEMQGLSRTVGRQRVLIVAIICLACVLFGLTLGTSVLGGSLIKETHIQESHVLTAGDKVVASVDAVQDLPLYYLPFMDAQILASTIGKSIMYTWNGNIVYDIVRSVSKPVNETAYEAHIRTASASISIKPAEAKLSVDGQETELCGGVTCSKVSLTMEDDLEEAMQKALGEHGARRLHGRRLHYCPVQGFRHRHFRCLVCQCKPQGKCGRSNSCIWTGNECIDGR